MRVRNSRYRYNARHKRRYDPDATSSGPLLRLLLCVAAALLLAGIVLAVAAFARRGFTLPTMPWNVTPVPIAYVTPSPEPHMTAEHTAEPIGFDEEAVAEADAYADTVVFGAGRAGAYRSLYTFDTAKKTLEKLDVVRAKTSIRMAAVSGAYIAYLDAGRGGGGYLRVVERASNDNLLIKSVPYGLTSLALEGRYLVWTEQTGEAEWKLYACDLTSLENVAVHLYGDDAQNAQNGADVGGGCIVYTEARDGQTVLVAAEIETGLFTDVAAAASILCPQAADGVYAWLDADGALYVCGGEQAAVRRLLDGVTDYRLLADMIAVETADGVSVLFLDDGSLYLLAGAGAQLAAAADGLIVYTDAAGAVLKYRRVD